MSDKKYILPPIKKIQSISRINSSGKISSEAQTSKNLTSKKAFFNSIIQNHLEEMGSKLKEINSKFFENLDEINQKLKEMDEIANSELNHEKKPFDIDKELLKQYNFCDMKVDKKTFFHNDKALFGAKYSRNNQRNYQLKFERKNCRNLKEILTFSMKKRGDLSLNQNKFKQFAQKFDEIEKKVKFFSCFFLCFFSLFFFYLLNFFKKNKAVLEENQKKINEQDFGKSRKLLIHKIVKNTEKKQLRSIMKMRNPEKISQRSPEKSAIISPNSNKSPKKISISSKRSSSIHSPPKIQLFFS